MADHDTASILTLVQPKRPMTQAERARAYRERKKAAKVPATAAMRVEVPPASGPSANTPKATAAAVTAVTSHPVTSHVTPSRRSAASIMLSISALGLGAVGITMNGWFARSLGSTDIAGYLFLAIGMAADCVALAVPSVAALAWQKRQRATALAGWVIWAVTFAFALMAGVGFASVNIADVTASRASRTTPAVVTAQSALADAMAARDRECHGGVGKFCREREAAVNERRSALDAAASVASRTADPQTEAASRIIVWLSAGLIKPSWDDFAILRLMLLALLPQVGGVLLMIGRTSG
jgi:hypothetical protein